MIVGRGMCESFIYFKFKLSVYFQVHLELCIYAIIWKQKSKKPWKCFSMEMKRLYFMIFFSCCLTYNWYSKKSQKKQISVWEWIKNWNHRILSGWNLIFAYFIFLFFTMQFRYQQRFEDDNNTFVVMEYMENGMLLFISTSIINFWINKQVHFRISWICVRSWVLKFLRRYLFLWYFFRTICYSFYFVCFIL